ncbi:MAG: hypothetical protein OQL19_09315 [Gammaproteobacteria bacterium]|nr:hypothetical protein [Gammaproteobacteria bacterium]
MSYLIVTVVFMAYFVLHSIAASITMKQWTAKHWPELMPYYRLTFNALAVILSLPLLIVMFLFPGEPLWQWQGPGFYVTSGIALLAVYGFVYSLKYYDLSEFWGTRQLKERNTSVHDQENFHISPMHRYVRHPWYFFALVIIWTRDVSTVQLLVYLLVTAYFVIGSRMEERKLIAYHGEVYRKYQKKVAGVFPLPWKILSVEEAKSLVKEN